jgi:hypothetical protein
MKNSIKENIDNPEKLEQIYQSDKKSFEKEFAEIYSEISNSQLIEFWKIRLGFDKKKVESASFQKEDILYLLLSSFLAFFLIKIPQIFGFNFESSLFYEKNAGLIILFSLSFYLFFTKKNLEFNKIALSLGVFIVSAIYINLLPNDINSNSINLAFIHLPLMLWCLYGIIFIDFNLTDRHKRIDYIKYNGDLAVLGAVMAIAGVILAGVTIGLFAAIDIKIERFYMEYFGVWGLVSLPIVATFIIKNYSIVTNKIANIIANIFSPLVLITLVVYLISIVVTGKDPYNDREFLIIFNLMLLGVMAIIVFSVSEISNNKKQRFNEIVLFILSIVTLIIDFVAISAIFYRLGEYGFTPNRVVVLGSNMLIFGNLLLIMIDLFKVNFRNMDLSKVEIQIGKYLPIYVVWTVFVVFVLPFIFGLK